MRSNLTLLRSKADRDATDRELVTTPGLHGARLPRCLAGVAATSAMLAWEWNRQRHFSHVHPQHVADLMAGAPLLLGNKQNFARLYSQLGQMIQANGDEPESQPWVLFDTQAYPAAGVASGQLSFFNSTTANVGDPTLSNFATGKLDADYYFEIHRVHSMVHAMPNTNATVAITGAANDVSILHKTARGIVNGGIRGKPYFGFPLFYFGRPGGPLPFYAAYGTGTVANNVITVGETAENGGFPVLGNIVLSPANTWTGNMQFVAATAISAQTNLVYAMMGVLHRPVA